MEMFHAFIASPLTKAAVAGLIASALLDFQAFRAWKSWHDFAVYQWGTALFRWFQGAVIGLVVGGLGLFT
ncbi:MAG: hypothetical protein NUV51_04580 [Sulfuricaulis sp.]|nr:hypothetical protein [Sulfuricaulis sp.]